MIRVQKHKNKNTKKYKVFSNKIETVDAQVFSTNHTTSKNIFRF